MREGLGFRAPLVLLMAALGFGAVGFPAGTVLEAGEWYRGNTHAHTVLCGHADSTPEQVAQWYLDRGYHFLILSEHNRFIDPASVALPEDRREDFILVPGQEVTGNKVIHTTAMNTRELVPWDFDHIDKAAIVQNHVDGTRAAGGQAIVNHPNFHFALAARHLRPVRGLCLFELFNGHPSVHNEGDAENLSTEAMWDELLSDGMEIYGVSSDDAHHFQQLARNLSNPGRGWVMVEAESLAADALTEAMARGDFYASSGVFLTECRRGNGDEPYRLVVDEARTLNEIEALDVRGRSVTAAQEGWRIAFIGPEGRILSEVDGAAGAWEPEGEAPAYVRAKVTFTRRDPVHGLEQYFAWGQPRFFEGHDGKDDATAGAGSGTVPPLAAAASTPDAGGGTPRRGFADGLGAALAAILRGVGVVD